MNMNIVVKTSLFSIYIKQKHDLKQSVYDFKKERMFQQLAQLVNTYNEKISKTLYYRLFKTKILDVTTKDVENWFDNNDLYEQEIINISSLIKNHGISSLSNIKILIPNDLIQLFKDIKRLEKLERMLERHEATTIEITEDDYMLVYE